MKQSGLAYPLAMPLAEYSDTSGRQGHLGTTIVAVDHHLEVIESRQIQVGSYGPMVSPCGRAGWYFLCFQLSA